MKFVTINGDPWRPQASKPQPKARPEPGSDGKFHKGWLVEGIPPGALEAAKAAALKLGNEPWVGDEVWLNAAKPKKVRSKPYSIPQAAQECAALAERAGWLRVRVRELSSEARA